MSDAAGLRVRYDNVQTIADTVRKISRQIRLDIDRMDDAVKVVADTWDGEAHGVYLDVQRAYKARADHMHQTLEEVARLIEMGKDSYAGTDRKNASLIEQAR
ncbi:WXG100 family type VII secretion target [Streptomyces sp. B-S-A8]|uniref:ESAT-6-like protein n=1 Tax=Streptomyces solicavernae TaxID=3043614 RepID=A0ABT6S128_9ACTN|nr:WXG100 family type VII secretion target [Streptomyces sp. B-S-A8]MDI3390406.1 WXG100 family type VII secretion target [Streptomyces sp. B-S-A8]